MIQKRTGAQMGWEEWPGTPLKVLLFLFLLRKGIID